MSESIIDTRESIAPGAILLSQVGIPPGAESPFPTEGTVSYDEATKLWLGHLREAFELTSVVSDKVIERAIDIRDSGVAQPYGMLQYGTRRRLDFEPRADMRSLPDVRNGMEEALSIAYYLAGKDWQQELSVGSNNPYATVYERYAKFFEFAQENVYKTGFESVLDIEGGFKTGTTQMTFALENIIDVYKREYSEALTIHDFVAIAHNSWPYIAKKAALHSHYFFYTSSDPAMHTLKSTPNGLRLDYTEGAKVQMRSAAQKGEIKDRNLHPAFGCPALVNYGDGSAIWKLWDWHIQLAEKIYAVHYDGQPVSELLGTS